MARPATAAVRLLSGEREPVRLATTANIELSGLQTIDGVMTEVNDRVLVKDQSDARQNGIYTASAGAWFRASDARHPRTIAEGVTAHVQDGTENNGRVYRFRATPLQVGTSEIFVDTYLSANFVQEATEAVAAEADRAEAAAAAAEAAAGSVQSPVSRVATELQTMAGALAAPYILPAYRGLKISEFLTSTSPSSMQQPAAVAMIAALFSSSRYISADGEGIVIPTTTPIDVAAVAGMTGVAPGAKGVLLQNIGFTTQAGFPAKTLISRNFVKTVGSAVVTGNTTGIEAGMWVYGNGVGEGVFVLSVDIVASSGGQLTLSQKCYNGSTHTMNFEKLNYILDFAGFGQGNRVNRLQLKNIQFTFSNGGNGVRLPMNHYSCAIDNCLARGTPERVVFDGTWNPDGAGAGFKFTHNDISVGEVDTEPASRQSYGLVLNASDAHIDSNDVAYTKTAFVLGGGGYTIIGNHPWQGTSTGTRTTTTASVIFTAGAPRTVFNGNYIDNSFIEFTDTSIPPDRDWFGSISGSGNRFTNVETGTSFGFITMRPQRQNRTLRHFRLSDCLFTEKSDSGTISVSSVQSQLGYTINPTGQDNILTGAYEGIGFTPQCEPMTVVATDGAAKTTRTIPLASFPFGMGPARVTSVVMQSTTLGDHRVMNSITPSAKSVDIVSASLAATWVVTATSNGQQITATV